MGPAQFLRFPNSNSKTVLTVLAYTAKRIKSNTLHKDDTWFGLVTLAAKLSEGFSKKRYRP